MEPVELPVDETVHFREHPAPALTSPNGRSSRRTVTIVSGHPYSILSPTQSLVCQTITRFGQASTSQLRILHYQGTPYGTKTRSARHLKALSERGFIRRIPHRLYGYQQGSGEFIYCPPESAARTPNLHTLDITGLYVALHDESPGVIFDPEPWCHRKYRGQTVTPDGFVRLPRGDYWVEIDRGSESPSVIAKKMGQYINAFRSGGGMPEVLWIAHDINRVRTLEREAKKKGVPGLFTCLLYSEAVSYMITANNAGG